MVIAELTQEKAWSSPLAAKQKKPRKPLPGSRRATSSSPSTVFSYGPQDDDSESSHEEDHGEPRASEEKRVPGSADDKLWDEAKGMLDERCRRDHIEYRMLVVSGRYVLYCLYTIYEGKECREWDEVRKTWIFNSWECSVCQPKGNRKQGKILTYVSPTAKSDHKMAHELQRQGQTAEERGEGKCTMCCKSARNKKKARQCRYDRSITGRCAECIINRERCSYLPPDQERLKKKSSASPRKRENVSAADETKKAALEPENRPETDSDDGTGAGPASPVSYARTWPEEPTAPTSTPSIKRRVSKEDQEETEPSPKRQRLAETPTALDMLASIATQAMDFIDNASPSTVLPSLRPGPKN